LSTFLLKDDQQGKSMKENVAVVILAAGQGTRMKSNKAKVLHEIDGRPMIQYVVEAARKIAGENVIAVIGHQAQKVQETISDSASIYFAYQEKQRGTAHAVQCAMPHIPDSCDEVIILCGDVPLIRARTIAGLVDNHLSAARDITLLAVEVENPHGYGRILVDDSRAVFGIVEEADATATQKQIKLINAGIYCIRKAFLLNALPKIRTNNAQSELYLTDIIGIAHSEDKKIGVMVGSDPSEVIGVNTIEELKRVESIIMT
jgi:UDP-N-acetylglucosamine diphosphorylase/glucosamine-1-phosphate N-acetyltransferase